MTSAERLAHYQRLAVDATDAAWVEREVRRRSAMWDITFPGEVTRVPALTEAQLVEAASLAVDLYATAAAHGIDRDTVGGVTDFLDAAVDGIRSRDRR